MAAVGLAICWWIGNKWIGILGLFGAWLVGVCLCVWSMGRRFYPEAGCASLVIVVGIGVSVSAAAKIHQAAERMREEQRQKADDKPAEMKVVP
jgi:hypothetical protein